MSCDLSSLIMDIQPGEYLQLGDSIRVELVQKSGRKARLKVLAEKSVAIRKGDDAEDTAKQLLQKL